MREDLRQPNRISLGNPILARGRLLVVAVGMAGLMLVAALIVTVTLYRQTDARNETNAKNWKHLRKAEEVSLLAGYNQMVHVNDAGQVAITDYLKFGPDDVDQQLRLQLAAQAKKGDPGESERIFRNANLFPQPTSHVQKDFPMQQPSFNRTLQDAVASGHAEFLRLMIFDACVEDGDVVEVSVNDDSFAVVPLTSKGTTLSIPIICLPTSIAVKGIRDGVGGITVAFSTSQGKLYQRTIAVGEKAIVAVLEADQ